MSSNISNTNSRIEIIHLADKSKIKAFIDFPHDLYANDPNYVPMMYIEQEALLNPKKSPFFLHSTAEYFLARDTKDGKIVGRIAAIKNNNHIKYTDKNEGFFGFFDVINNYEVAKLLLDTASDWIQKQGMEKVIGPANFSTNETCGLLVENFSDIPYIMMTYNHQYYQEFLERYGYTKHVDLLAYKMRTADVDEKLVALGERIEERLLKSGITVRKINLKKFNEELAYFLPIYNEAWSENTGFVPMSDAEIKQIAKDLKPAVDPDLIYFAMKDGKAIGVSLGLPNVNEVQRGVNRGRLLPFGVFKLLWGLKTNKIKTVRIVALGTMKEYRRLGIDAVFYAKNAKACKAKGIIEGEGSWILENNVMMNRTLENLGGKVYRRYRLYEKTL
jgi:GNAT superfamily N-acetyltransferase